MVGNVGCNDLFEMVRIGFMTLVRIRLVDIINTIGMDYSM